jgi:hypothetical protein
MLRTLASAHLLEEFGKKKTFFYFLGHVLELIIKIWRFGFIILLKSGEFGPFLLEKSFV